MEGLDRVLEPLGWTTEWLNSGGNCMIIEVNAFGEQYPWTAGLEDYSGSEETPFIWITSADTVIPEDRYAGTGGEPFSPWELNTDIQNALADRGFGDCWDEFHIGHYANWHDMEKDGGIHFQHSYIKGVENLASSLVAMIRAFYLPITSEEEAVAWTDALAFLDFDFHLDDDPDKIEGIVNQWHWQQEKVFRADYTEHIFTEELADHIRYRQAEWRFQGGWGLFELYPEAWAKWDPTKVNPRMTFEKAGQ
jgi:hypothetical protein